MYKYILVAGVHVADADYAEVTLFAAESHLLGVTHLTTRADPRVLPTINVQRQTERVAAMSLGCKREGTCNGQSA